MENREFVTKQGLFTSIVVTVIGVGIFSYPSELIKLVGSDGWIITIASGIVNWLLLLLFYIVIKKNEYDTFYDMLNNNLGSFISKIAALTFAVFNILVVALGMRIFSEVIKMYLLEKTPTEFILLVLILCGTYLVRGKVRAIVKFNELAFWIMFLPIIFIIVLALKGADFTNIFPIFNNEPVKYINAMKTGVYSFSGYQIAFLLIPYCKHKKETSKILFKSMLFITAFYVVITVLCIATFNKNMTSTLLWPTITMIKSIDIPGTFIERWEGVAMALWVMFYFTTFTNSYYFSADLVKNALKLGDIRVSTMVITPFIYAIALYPENIGELYDISSKYVSALFIACIIILPLILFATSILKKRRPSNNEV